MMKTAYPTETAMLSPDLMPPTNGGYSPKGFAAPHLDEIMGRGLPDRDGRMNAVDRQYITEKIYGGAKYTTTTNQNITLYIGHLGAEIEKTGSYMAESGLPKQAGQLRNIKSMLEPLQDTLSTSGDILDESEATRIKEEIDSTLAQIDNLTGSMKKMDKDERKEWYEREGEEMMNERIEQLRDGLESLKSLGSLYEYENDLVHKIQQQIPTILEQSVFSSEDVAGLKSEPKSWIKLRALLIKMCVPEQMLDEHKDKFIGLIQGQHADTGGINPAALLAEMYENLREEMEAPFSWDKIQEQKELQASTNKQEELTDEELTTEQQDELREKLETIGAGAVLPLAAEHGKRSTLKFLLEAGADPNAKDETGWTAMHHASKRGDDQMVEALVAHKADLNIYNNDDWTPVYIASVYAKIEVVKILLREKVDISLQTKTGFIALHEAVISGSVDLTRMLHEYEPSFINKRTKNGYTPLIIGVMYFQASTVRFLLDNGADIELATQSPEGEAQSTPLYYACDHGHLRMVQILLEYKASLEAKDSFGHTPFLRAVYKGRAKVVEYLITEQGIQLEEKDRNGNRAMHLAIYRGSSETVKVLTKHNAKVNVRNKVGMSPLHIACSYGHIQIVRHLLDPTVGSVITAREIEGWTPLSEAAHKGHIEIVDLLLNRSAPVTEVDDNNWTALHRAASGNHPKVIERLLLAGAEIEAQTVLDWTPLHAAACRGANKACYTLIHHNANVAAVESSGFSTSALAKNYGYHDTAALLNSALPANAAKETVENIDDYTYGPSVLPGASYGGVLPSSAYGSGVLPTSSYGSIPLQASSFAPGLYPTSSYLSSMLSSSFLAPNMPGPSLATRTRSRSSTEAVVEEVVDEAPELREAPKNPRTQRKKRVICDFDPEDESGKELRVLEGDIVVVVKEDPKLTQKGWCMARLQQERTPGLVPLSYLEDI